MKCRLEAIWGGNLPGIVGRLLLVFFILFFPGILPAQTSALFESWRWIDLGPNLGLPPGRVLDLCETAQGDVWVLTAEGIAWFDGYRWNHVAGDSLLRASIGKARISPDSAGILIVAADRLYHASRTSVQPMAIHPLPSELPIERAFALPNGSRVLQTPEQLYLSRGADCRVLPSPYRTSTPRRLSEQSYGLRQTANGRLWLNARGGLYVWQDGEWKNWLNDQGMTTDVSVVAENIEGVGLAAMYNDAEGYLLEWGRGYTPREVQMGQGLTVLSGDVARNGDAIVLLSSSEVQFRNAGRWVSLDPMPQAMVGATMVRFRPNGDLWVGTEEGLFLCRLTSKMWSVIRAPMASSVFSVNEIMLSQDGALWWGTSFGVHVLDRSGAFRVIDRIGDRSLGIVTGVAEDQDHNVWISSGSSFPGAYRWDGKTWKHFGSEEGLSAEGIHRIAKDRQGRLWFLSIATLPMEGERGAYVLDHGKFENLDMQRGLPDGRVYSMAEDSTGGLWFGTLTGLARLRQGEWTSWSKAQGLKGERTFALVVDRQNRLWFGHQKGGLGYIDQHDSVRYITPEEGLTNTDIWSLSIDKTGRMWVATRGGVSTYANGQWSTITVQHGLPNVYVWPILPLEDMVLLGTRGAGIVVFRHGLTPEMPPRVRFDDPLVRRQETVISWVAESYWGAIPHERIETRYRLDNKAWSGWGVSRYVVLRNLPSGEHMLEVQSKSLLGEINAIPASRHFEILPPLYLRPQVLIPFLSLLVLLLGTGLIFYIRKREYDRELRQQDARYRAVVEQQTELIARIQTDGTFSFVNDAFCRFLGRRRDEIVGKPIMDVMRPENGAQLSSLLGIKPGTPLAEDELRWQDADGHVRWIHSSATVITDSPEAITEIQLVGRDITEQKSTRDELEENERRNRIVLEQTGQLVYDYDIASGTIHWSGAIQEVTGFTDEEFETVDINEWGRRIHPDDRPGALDELERVMKRRERYQMEYRFLHRNGSYVHVMDNGIFLHGGEEGPHRMLGTMSDITTRKLAEAQITSSLKEKEVLLKEVHHRVKNNLQVISSLLNLQASGLADKHALAQLRESQDRIRSMALIHERLYQSENLALVNFGEYLRDLANSLFRSYGLGRVRLRVNVQPINLGVNLAIPCGLIINELLTNALKYAFPDGRDGEVELRLALTDKGLCVLTVSDNGIGFPPGLDFRHSPSLGLQLVNTLTTQIDGTIEMTQKPGTAFAITFPPVL
jgi:PAS domain S-box-containing protein